VFEAGADHLLQIGVREIIGLDGADVFGGQVDAREARSSEAMARAAFCENAAGVASSVTSRAAAATSRNWVPADFTVRVAKRAFMADTSEAVEEMAPFRFLAMEII
jgi:hypothetical protein